MVLVCYDVSTIDRKGARRLRQVAKICLNYGQRVQRSVFECIIAPNQWTFMRQQLVEVIDQKQDSLRFYFLGENWQKKIEHIGAKKVLHQEGPIIV